MSSTNNSGGHSGLTAQRFEGKPLTQPAYSFRNVPKCSRNLSNSTITYVDRREPFVDSMAEMVLLTKEVMRRQAEAQEAELAAEASASGKKGRGKNKKKGKRQAKVGSPDTKKRTSKPLSLEYMADRTDVDDPIFGYFVRTDTLPEEYVGEVEAAKKKEEQDATKEEKVEARRTRSRMCKKDGAPQQEADVDGDKKPAAAASSLSSGAAADSLQSLPPPPEEEPINSCGSADSSIQPYAHRINPLKVQPSMLQGFVAVTTFTNWQTTFRWDSMHDSAFSYDEPHMAQQMASGERKFDYDGKLAEDMQATVRSGDPWNEGIVWPRIAEISLLGGLGCGKVSLHTGTCFVNMLL